MTNKNRKAWLDTIAFSEGTKGVGDDGYNVIVGGSLFHSYADHPRVLVNLPRLGIKSTCAGRYQLKAKYFDPYKKLLNLHDFGHVSQDLIAIQQTKEQRALDDVDAGRFDAAVEKCRNIWASFPGAGYGQRENKIGKLRNAFVRFGGTLSV